MNEIILSQFKSGGIPTMWLLPTIDIITTDWLSIISWDGMVEISEG